MAIPILAQTFPTIAVAVIYCLWYRAHLDVARRKRTLRERVAFMLWCAAEESS